MRLTNRGIVVLVLVTFFAGVFVALALHSGYEQQSESAPSPRVEACTNGIIADLDVWAEGDNWEVVPAPTWEAVESACATGAGHDGDAVVSVWEDGSYTVAYQYLGPVWTGCPVGAPCWD